MPCWFLFFSKTLGSFSDFCILVHFPSEPSSLIFVISNKLQKITPREPNYQWHWYYVIQHQHIFFFTIYLIIKRKCITKGSCGKISNHLFLTMSRMLCIFAAVDCGHLHTGYMNHSGLHPGHKWKRTDIKSAEQKGKWRVAARRGEEVVNNT